MVLTKEARSCLQAYLLKVARILEVNQLETPIEAAIVLVDSQRYFLAAAPEALAVEEALRKIR